MECSPKVFTCTFLGCTMSFSQANRLIRHELLHQNVRTFPCKEENCTKAYSSQAHLNRHIAAVHKKTIQHKIYCCPLCATTFVNRQNLKRHLSNTHMSSLETFRCDECNLVFKKKHQLSVHMYRHTGVKAFNCEMCPESFVSPYERRRHMRFHKIYKCDVCFEEFNLWSLYQKHRKSNHLTGEYMCDHCQRNFKKRTHIVRHMKTHYELKSQTFECHYYNCNREYVRKSSLLHHIKVTHQNIRFNCTICSGTMASKASLQSHMQKHFIKTVRPPPKTKLTGRKERWDKGLRKGSTALEVIGIPPDIVRSPETESQLVQT